ncbi:TIGR01777 family oxidoreductase [Coraliomargarita algicola]|uniref:TIGR01777 family oxidoreductase n=1 Tax=Coraliomargarita algicola TaxID=3092156 RepID=A0ABZ0RHT4_9BACT|nr:TIGR01777 family oxidoreductase [Coraliomargarita sp. J2-16]WPJ94633.1 TIGR01777 family oxidoreductase [Coraliomargarita sp. J2-16]
MSPSLTILISGATGLIGKPLCAALQARGHQIRTLSRSKHGDVQWDVDAGRLDAAALNGVDAVIHLAGESVVQRWTAAAKERILQSRVQSTRLLVDAILQQAPGPAFISASGISYYGTDLEAWADESSPMGDGFLAEVTQQWEAAARPLSEAGIRTAFMRTGIVLSGQGGALAKMLTPFRLGVGGRIGNGQQQMSWISLPDLVQAYIFAVENESVCGAINAVAPLPVSNAEFTATLGTILGRPTVFPVPAAIVKMIFGEMGEETVLSNLAVRPQRLTELGFEWQHPELESALLAAIH